MFQFLIAAMTNYYKPSGVIAHRLIIEEFYISEILKSRCQQGCVSSTCCRAQAVAWPPPASRGCHMPWLVSTSSLLSQQSSIFQSLSFSDLLLLSLQLFLSLSYFPVFLVRTLVTILGSDDPQQSHRLKILNHVSPLVHIHRFQRLGCGHLWGGHYSAFHTKDPD